MPQWVPSAVAVIVSNTQTARALLQVEGDVLWGEGQPASATGNPSWGVLVGNRLVLLGEKAVLTRARVTLSTLASFPWSDKRIFFTLSLQPSESERLSLSSRLRHDLDAHLVWGQGRRLGVLVGRELEQDARALCAKNSETKRGQE
jgi:hypothetical protein